MKLIVIPVLLVLAIATARGGQAQMSIDIASASGAPPLSVDQAVALALQSNLEIRAAVRRLSLAKMKVSTARSLEDPMLSVRDWSTPLSKPWDLNQAQLMFMVQQTFASRVKRDMRAKVAGDEVEIAAEDVETARHDVAADVRKMYSELIRNADAFSVHERQSALLKEAVAAALAQYTIGKIPQAEVLRAQMAVTRLNEHMIELEQDRDNSRAQLNALLGRRPGEPIAISGSYLSTPALPPLEELERVAIEHRPELAALRKQMARSRDESQLMRLATKPDFTAGLGYMLMPTGSASRNAYMAEFSMNLPLLNRARHDNETQQADAASDVTQAELDARTSAVFLEVRQAQIEILASEHRVKLYRDTLLPQADAALKASTAAFQNNRTEFSNLIESQNLLLDIQTSLYNAAAATDAGVARLERAVGAPLATRDQGPHTAEGTSK